MPSRKLQGAFEQIASCQLAKDALSRYPVFLELRRCAHQIRLHVFVCNVHTSVDDGANLQSPIFTTINIPFSTGRHPSVRVCKCVSFCMYVCLSV